MKIVTSFSREGFEVYGKRMLQSLKLNTPFSAVVYADGFEMPKTDRVISIHQGFATPELYQFRRRFEKRKKPGSYSYRWDAGKFAGKAYAIIHAMKNMDRFIWLDGDTVFMQKINGDFFRHCWNSFSCYLGRKRMHTETGFLSFNMSHPAGDRFLQDFEALYNNDTIYNLKEWHDCEAFDAVRGSLPSSAFTNLTPNAPRGSHPFVEFFHPFIDHMKGPTRKKLGQSPEYIKKTRG